MTCEKIDCECMYASPHWERSTTSAIVLLFFETNIHNFFHAFKIIFFFLMQLLQLKLVLRAPGICCQPVGDFQPQPDLDVSLVLILATNRWAS